MMPPLSPTTAHTGRMIGVLVFGACFFIVFYSCSIHAYKYTTLAFSEQGAHRHKQHRSGYKSAG